MTPVRESRVYGAWVARGAIYCGNVGNLFNNKLYLFNAHLDRFFTSCKLAKLARPKTRDEIYKILSLMAQVVGEKTLNFRYWCSRGAKDLDVTTPEDEPSVFYCIAMKGRPVAVPVGEMMNAYTVTTEVKGPLLAEIKTTNYMLNCLAADEAKKKGGLPVMTTEDGYVTEGAVQSIGMLLDDGLYYVPPYYRALRSTTVDRLLQLIEDKLIPKGEVKGIVRMRMKVDELKAHTKEMMFIGGDKVIPIRYWDDKKISEKKGEITEKLHRLLVEDRENTLVAKEIMYTKL